MSPLEEEMKHTIEEILRYGSEIDIQADLLFKESDGVRDSELRGRIKEVAREAMTNWGNAANVVLDVWNNKNEEVSIDALNGMLNVMKEFKKEVGVLRGIIRV